MGRIRTGRELSTFLRLSKEGRRALKNLLEISGFTSKTEYADKLFRELEKSGDSVVARQPKKDND